MNDLLEVAREAARRGAEVLERRARHVSGQRLSSERKASDIDLVTEADLEAERAILEVLRTTGISIVAEESGGAADERVWYVDPLDGTTNFAHGHPFVSVSIGLVVAGEPRLGVVHAPMLGVVFSGGPGLVSTRRDLFRGIERPLAVSSVDRLDRALAATGFPYDRHTSSDDNLAAFSAMIKRAQGVMRCGSAALDLALVADGTYDVFWERKLKPWDLAAGAALVLAASGVVTDPFAGPFRAESGTIAASNGILHEALLAVVRDTLP